MKFKSLLFLVVCAELGCSAGRVVTRTTLPPRSRELGDVQRIMLVEFDGPRGEEARRRVSSLVVRGRLHKIVDQSNQGVRMAELEKQVAGGTVAVKGGTGATILVGAQTTPDDYAANVEQFEEKKCTKWNKKRKCTKYVKIPGFRLTEACSSTLHGKVVRVADGQVLVQRTFTARQADTVSQMKRPPPSARQRLCAGAAQEATDRFAGFITPVESQVALEFHPISDADGRSDKAIEHARQAKFGRAKSLFEAAVVDPALDAEARSWSRYNLAVVLWALANFDGCIEQLDLAAEALPSADEISKMRTGCSEYLQ